MFHDVTINSPLRSLRMEKGSEMGWIKWIFVPGACVGGGGGGFGLFPNVVNAVELTPKSTIKTVKSIVRLPHCVNRFNGCILNVLI